MKRVWFAALLLTLALLGALFFRGALAETFVWLQVEAPALVRQLRFSLVRLSKALLLATVLGLGLGLPLRVSRELEGTLTPWLLTLLAVPWLPMIVLLNLLAGLTENAAMWVGALAAAPQIAYGLRPLNTPKGVAAGFLRGYRLVFFAIALAEILGRDTGVGSQIRFFFLFWNTPRLIAYSAILLLLWLVVELATRFMTWLVTQQFYVNKV